MLVSRAGGRSCDQTTCHLHIIVHVSTGRHFNILLLHLHVAGWNLLLLVVMLDDISRLLLNIRINLARNLIGVVQLALVMLVTSVLYLGLDILLQHILIWYNRLYLGLLNLSILSIYILICFQSFYSFDDLYSMESNFNLKIVF